MVVDVASKVHQIPEALWDRIGLVLPIYNRSCNGGRPRLPSRRPFSSVFSFSTILPLLFVSL
jgi:hypothetical protein